MNQILEEQSNISIDESVFLQKWVANGFNGARAYAEIHKDITYESACVGASRMLRKVNISSILEIRNLGIEKFITQLEYGLSAEQIDKSGKSIPDHKTRYLYLMTLGKLLNLFSVNPDNNSSKNNNIWSELKAKYTI